MASYSRVIVLAQNSTVGRADAEGRGVRGVGDVRGDGDRVPHINNHIV